MRPRGHDWYAESANDSVEFVQSTAYTNSTACEDNRSFCCSDSCEHITYLRLNFGGLEPKFVFGRIIAAQSIRIDIRSLYVYGDVQPARSWPPVPSQVPCTFQVIRD